MTRNRASNDSSIIVDICICTFIVVYVSGSENV